MSYTQTFGRKLIFSDVAEVTAENVVEVLQSALSVHNSNAAQINYLHDYYLGNQDILTREKTVRPEVTHNVVVNKPYEIVSFCTGYLLNKPITYVNRSGSDDFMPQINLLNDYMYVANKPTRDKEIADEFAICGVAYRIVLPSDDEDCPFEIHTLRSCDTFVIRRNDVSQKKLAGVTRTIDSKGTVIYTVYTRNMCFTVENGSALVKAEPHILGEIPIIEYINNSFRLGAFEPVLGLVDKINVLESNRVEATEQNVQALTWFNNVALSDEGKQQLRDNPSAFIFTQSVDGAAQASIKTITVELQQADQQVLLNDLKKQIMEITGMPSVGDGSTADSSNNGATIVRNGWYNAEARATAVESLWRESEREFLRVVLSICRSDSRSTLNLPLSAIGEKFTRHNYEDISAKATVLTMLLSSDKVHPQKAYEACNLFIDPDEACTMGLEWFADETRRMSEAIFGDDEDGEAEDVRDDGQIPEEGADTDN